MSPTSASVRPVSGAAFEQGVLKREPVLHEKGGTHTAAEHELDIGGVDQGVGLGFRYIGFFQDEFHRVPITDRLNEIPNNRRKQGLKSALL